jgi:ABC-2 type transport system ATP-binding protein
MTSREVHRFGASMPDPRGCDTSVGRARLLWSRPVLELEGVRKTYGEAVVLDDLSLRLEPGEVFGLLGPNGAGKTTLVSLAVGLLAPTAGRVTIRGQGPPSSPTVRRAIGLAPQALALYERLSARENLDFFAAMQGLDARTRARRVDEALAFVGLSERADARPSSFSGGMARRLNLAAALVHEPALLLLDEPTVGVDPQSRNLLLERIAALREQGRTILYTTHYMEEAARVCDRIGILDRGRLLAVDTVAGLIAAHGGAPRLIVEFAGEAELVQRSEDPYASLRALVDARGEPPRRFRVEQPSLEQVFLELTGRSLRDE